jgi:hypothetical protein
MAQARTTGSWGQEQMALDAAPRISIELCRTEIYQRDQSDLQTLFGVLVLPHGPLPADTKYSKIRDSLHRAASDRESLSFAANGRAARLLLCLLETLVA